jgi:AsmA protein
MEHLYHVLGIALPDTKPYRTSGRLVRQGTRVRYENFSGRVGESDLAGTLEIDTAGKRPFMSGELVSKKLNLADLGPVVGTEQPRPKGVLPDAPFNTERWDSIDADVRMRAASIERPRQLPLEHLTVRVRMRDKALALDPLQFGVAGGRLSGIVRLDGGRDPIRAQTSIRLEKLALAKLFPTVKENRASIGAVDGVIELTGNGNSVGRMLASASGKVGVFVDSGEVSAYLMQLVALDLWGIARVKLAGDEPVPIRCAILDFSVKNGLMQANALVFDTALVNVGGDGRIDLKDERLDLALFPQPKQRSVASLNSPLYLRGTFGEPKVAPDWNKLAAKGAGALVMGILNPLLAVLPLVNEGPGKDSNCAGLIREASTRGAEKSASRSAAAPASSGGSSAAPRR